MFIFKAELVSLKKYLRTENWTLLASKKWVLMQRPLSIKQLAITCPKSTIETPEQCAKSVQR